MLSRLVLPGQRALRVSVAGNARQQRRGYADEKPVKETSPANHTDAGKLTGEQNEHNRHTSKAGDDQAPAVRNNAELPSKQPSAKGKDDYTGKGHKASRSFSTSAFLNREDIGTRPPKTTVDKQSMDKVAKSTGSDVSQAKPEFNQDPEVSNITASTPTPSQSQTYVKGSPDPDSYKRGYEEITPSQSVSTFGQSSTSSAPAHEGLAKDVKAGKHERKRLGTEGTHPKVPPDFNPEVANKAPDWPGKKEELGDKNSPKASY